MSIIFVKARDIPVSMKKTTDCNKITACSFKMGNCLSEQFIHTLKNIKLYCYSRDFFCTIPATFFFIL